MLRFILLVISVISCNVYAETYELLDDHDIAGMENCLRAWSEDDAEITTAITCMKQEYQLADAKLNKVYGDVYRYIELVPRARWNKGEKDKIDVEQLNLLKESQRAWINFRDKECTLVISSEDDPKLTNPYAEVEWLKCMTLQTNTRIRQLQSYRGHDFYPSPLTRG